MKTSKKMLWYASGKKYKEIIADAAMYYENKYGDLPNFVEVSADVPKTKVAELNEAENITVSQSNLPAGHFTLEYKDGSVSNQEA